MVLVLPSLFRCLTQPCCLHCQDNEGENPRGQLRAPGLIPGGPSSFLGQKNEVQTPAFLKHPSPGHPRAVPGVGTSLVGFADGFAEGAQQLPPAFPLDEKEQNSFFDQKKICFKSQDGLG